MIADVSSLTPFAGLVTSFLANFVRRQSGAGKTSSYVVGTVQLIMW